MDCPLSGISNDTGGRLKPLTENVDPCLFHASSTTTPSKVTRLPPLACELKMMPDSSRVISIRVCQRAENKAEAESPIASGTPLQQLCQCLPSNTRLQVLVQECIVIFQPHLRRREAVIHDAYQSGASRSHCVATGLPNRSRLSKYSCRGLTWAQHVPVLALLKATELYAILWEHTAKY